MKKFILNLFKNIIKNFSYFHLKEENSFSFKKLIIDDNPYQKYGLAAAGGTVVSFVSILIMALLIATGEVSLDDVNLRKIN